jgi:hypothetical protein
MASAAVGLRMPRRSSLGRSPADPDRGEDLFRRLPPRCARLVGDLDVRHRIDELGDEVVLRALHQRGHRDREADADRHPEDGDDRLPAAAGEVGEGYVEDQAHGLSPSPASPACHHAGRAGTAR